MAEEFLIELGVDINSTAAEAKLNTLKDEIKNTKSTPIEMTVDTKSILSEISTVNKKIKTITEPKSIKLTLNADNVDSQLNSIENKIRNLSNVKINLSGAGLNENGGRNSQNNINEVTAAYKELMSLQQRMNTYGKKVNSLDTKKDVQQIQELESKISELSLRYDDLFDQFGNQLSSTQLDNLNRTIEITNENIDIMRAKMADTSAIENQTKQAQTINEAYKETISTIKEMGSIQSKIVALDSTKDTNQITTLNQQLSDLQVKYDGLISSFGQKFDTKQLTGINEAFKDVSNNVELVNSKMADMSAIQQQKASAEQIEQSYKELMNLAKQMNTLELKIGGLDAEKNSSEIATLTKQLETFRSEYAELSVQMNGKLSTSQLEALGQSFSDLQYKLDDLNSKYQDTRNKLAQGIIDETGNSQLEANFSKLSASLDKIKTQSAEVVSGMERFKNAETELKAAREGNDTERIITANQEYENALKNVENQIKINIQEEKKLADAQKEQQAQAKLEQSKTALSSQMDIWLRNNSAAAKDFGEQIKLLQTELQSCDATRLNGIKAEFQEITRRADLAGKATQTFGDKFKTQLSKLGTYFSAAALISYGITALRSMYDNVLSVDTAMTQLYRVTDLTTQQYSDMYDKMAQSAKNYGATLDSIINSTASWVRLGFNPNDAERLSEITAMYQHVTDLDEETAVKNLVTAYKGFEQQLLTLTNGDSAAAIELVADIYDKLGNEFAESAADVGDGLAKAAAVLQQGGNSIQQSAAMFTGIQEVMQDSGVAGSTLKILTLRLRGMKGELEELGEEVDDNVESISKMQTQILNFTHGKVNIFNDDGTFKSTYEIMQGIAEIYNDLTDTERAGLLETIAGKNRASGVQALLSNWSQVEKAFDAATNAEGTAAEEQEKYMASLQGHLNQLSSAWQVFSNDFLNSNFLKGCIDFLTSVLNLLDLLIKNIGVIPTLLGGAGIGAIIKNFGSSNEFALYGCESIVA